MPRSPKSDNSGEDVDNDSLESDDERDYKSRGTEQPSPAAVGSTRRLEVSVPGLQLFRSESSNRRGPQPGAHKTQSLEVLTEMLSIDGGDSSLVSGFDPGRWIVAAGLLEKRRDGRMREGWAKRWFVLGKHTLYYYLLPKTDMGGYTPLLGDERGQIKLTDIQDVQAPAHDKEHWYLNITVVNVRKNNASQYFGNQVSQLQLRTPAETGQLWMDAIIGARDAARNGASPTRPLTTGRKNAQQLQQQQQSADSWNSQNTIGLGSASLISNLPLVSSTATILQPQRSSSDDPQQQQRQQRMAAAAASRPRRDSTRIRALDLIPLEQSFPFASPVPILPFLLVILANTVVGFFSEQFSLTPYVPSWTEHVPRHVFLLINAGVFACYVELKRRSIHHNSVAREARFRAEILRKELNASKQDLLAIEQAVGIVSPSPLGGGGGGGVESPGTRLLPMTNSEIVRAEEALQKERHCAGSSMSRKTQPMVPGQDFMSWNDAPGNTFKVRVGPNYKKNGGKAPSGDPLYSLLALDLLRSKDRICNLGGLKKVDLPAHRPGIDPSMEDLRKAGLPRLFIVNAQVPDKAPPMMGKNLDDSGYSLVFYFVVKPQLVSQILSNQMSPATKLLKQYVKEHRTNPDIRRRFKAIGMADNAKELGIPGVSALIDKFNGKPAIINKVAEIYESPGGDMDWFEVDISIFDFPYLAKRTLFSLKDRVSEIALRAGFVMQGETDEELPECLIGGGEICGLDFRLAKVI